MNIQDIKKLKYNRLSIEEILIIDILSIMKKVHHPKRDGVFFYTVDIKTYFLYDENNKSLFYDYSLVFDQLKIDGIKTNNFIKKYLEKYLDTKLTSISTRYLNF